MNKAYRICVILIFLVSLVVVGWFKEGRIIYFWDATTALNPTKAIANYKYTWSESTGFGETDIFRVKLIPYLLITFLTYSLLGLLYSQILLYFFLFSFSGISMFLLTYELLKKDDKKPQLLLLGSVSAALFYMFNLYAMLFLWRIFSTSLFMYSALPLIFLFYVRFLDGASAKMTALIPLVILFFFSSVSHPSLILLLFVFLLLFLLYLIATQRDRKNKISKFSIIIIIALLVNAYWLLPLIGYNMSAQGDISSTPYGGTISALHFNSQFASLLSIFRLKGQQILYEQYLGEYAYPWITIYQDQKMDFFTVVPFIIPLICFFPLLFRKRYYLFFGIASLLWIFLVKGIHEPLGNIYEFLFSSIPFFVTFRDPYSKFGLFYTFCMSFLFGAGITEMQFSLGKTLKRFKLNYIIPSIFILLLTVPYMFPMWTGDVIFKGDSIRPSAMVEVPPEYVDLSMYLENESQQFSFKVLELPFQDRPLQSCLWNSGYVGYPAIRTLTYLPTISGISGNEKLNEFYRSLYNDLETNPPSVLPLLRLLNIKYIILHEDINPSFAPPTTDPSKLRTLLENSDGLTFVKQFGKLSLWQLNEVYPAIYGIMKKDGANITHFSFEDEDISLELLSPEGKVFSFSVDSTTKYEGSYSLRVTTNTTSNRLWSWLASTEIDVRKGDLYQIMAHIKAYNVVQSHIVILGFNETSLTWEQLLQNPNGQDGTFEWREFSKILTIPQNITKIRLVFNAGWVEDGTKGNATTWFDDVTITRILGEQEILTFPLQKINPTLWKAELVTQEPLVIVFTEGYDPLWTCYVNGERIESQPLYGVVNSFWVNQTGVLDVVVEYEPQRWFYYGSIISVTTLIACLTYLIYNWTKSSRTGRPRYNSIGLHEGNKTFKRRGQADFRRSNSSKLKPLIKTIHVRNLKFRIRLEGGLEYFKENWGAPFIIAFMIMLTIAAYLTTGNESYANDIAVYAYYALFLGVILQLASYIKQEHIQKTVMLLDEEKLRRLNISRRRRTLKNFVEETCAKKCVICSHENFRK